MAGSLLSLKDTDTYFFLAGARSWLLLQRSRSAAFV